MRKIIPIIMILLVGSCTLFNQGPDPYNIAEWVEKPPIGTKLTFRYYIYGEEENGWTREYTLSHIYEDDTIFTVYYTFFNDSNDMDPVYREDTMFLTVNFKTNRLWWNGWNPQEIGENGEVVLKTPIEEGYIFDNNCYPGRVNIIDNVDTTYCTLDDTLYNIVKIYDNYFSHYYSLEYIVCINSFDDYLSNIITELKDVE